MKNRETIVRAKSEILPPARTVVLNVDVPELAAKADEYAATKRVIRVATDPTSGADVVVRRLDGDAEGAAEVTLEGETHRVVLPAGTDHPSNVAVAVGLALALEVPVRTVRTASRASPARRTGGGDHDGRGPTVIDDTYNSNPTGAARPWPGR